MVRQVHGPNTRYCLGCAKFACPHTLPPPPALNWREVEIIRLLVRTSASNKELAHQSGLTEGTLKEYLFAILAKLRKAGYPVDNRTALAMWGAEHLRTQTESAAAIE